MTWTRTTLIQLTIVTFYNTFPSFNIRLFFFCKLKYLLTQSVQRNMRICEDLTDIKILEVRQFIRIVPYLTINYSKQKVYLFFYNGIIEISTLRGLSFRLSISYTKKDIHFHTPGGPFHVCYVWIGPFRTSFFK